MKGIKQGVAAVMLFSVVASQAQAAGVPVIDVGSIAQQIIQVNEARKRLQAMSGNVGLGTIINDPYVRAQLNQYLPKQYNDVLQAVKNGDLGALQGVYNQVLQNEQNYEGRGKERAAAQQLINQAQVQGILKSLDVRSTKLNGLMNQLNNTTDLSSKADLSAAIQAESAAINLDFNRASVAMKQMELLQQAADRQAEQEYWKSRRTHNSKFFKSN